MAKAQAVPDLAPPGARRGGARRRRGLGRHDAGAARRAIRPARRTPAASPMSTACRCASSRRVSCRPMTNRCPGCRRAGRINDASALSETPVYGIVAVSSEEHIAKALAFARANGLKVSMSAIRHSMGGHAFDDSALVLDMRGFNAIEVDAEARTMTVQPGATWHDIQNRLHPRFAVKAMQSTDIFSVGGSISVNAHGMDHQAGSVAGTIRSMRVMLADGSVVTCSRTENADLFRHVVGGYGLFGVVLSADARHHRQRRLPDVAQDHPLGRISRLFRHRDRARQESRPVLRPPLDRARQFPRGHDRLSLRQGGRRGARRPRAARRALRRASSSASS